MININGIWWNADSKEQVLDILKSITKEDILVSEFECKLCQDAEGDCEHCILPYGNLKDQYKQFDNERDIMRCLNYIRGINFTDYISSIDEDKVKNVTISYIKYIIETMQENSND